MDNVNTFTATYNTVSGTEHVAYTINSSIYPKYKSYTKAYNTPTFSIGNDDYYAVSYHYTSIPSSQTNLFNLTGIPTPFYIVIDASIPTADYAALKNTSSKGFCIKDNNKDYAYNVVNRNSYQMSTFADGKIKISVDTSHYYYDLYVYYIDSNGSYKIFPVNDCFITTMNRITALTTVYTPSLFESYGTKDANPGLDYSNTIVDFSALKSSLSSNTYINNMQFHPI